MQQIDSDQVFPREPPNNKPYILVKHAIQAFFQNTGLIFTRKYAYFRWLAAFFSVKGQTSPLIYVVESFRPAIASEYHLAPANRAYKRFSFQTVIDSVLSGRIRQIKPDLKQVHPQHFLDAHRRTFSFFLGIIRFNYAYPFIPWNNFIHDLKKFFSSCLLYYDRCTQYQ